MVLEYWAVDNTGLAEARKRRTIEFTPTDATPPEIHPTVSGSEGGDGWYVSDVSVAWSVQDPESEITAASGCDAVAIADDTAGITFTCTATSAGGTTSVSVNIKRDATAPVLAFHGNEERYTVDQRVEITCTGADALSGVASADCPELDADAYTLGLGEHELVARATDGAGNEGSGEARFSVEVTYGSLCILVGRFSTSQGTARSLCQLLDSAEMAERRGQSGAKGNQLRAFALHVRAQSGRTIPVDKAEVLVRLADAL